MMRRREFMTLLGGATAWPVAARAQNAEPIRRIGVLMSNAETDVEGIARVKSFEQGLQKLGWTKRNVVIDYRWRISDADTVQQSVQSLIDLHPDVLLAHTPASVAALKQATRSTPIIFVQASDPVSLGLITDLARPGENVTGFVLFEPSLGGKWLQLLRDVAPSITRVLVIRSPDNPSSAGFLHSIEKVASSLSIALSTASVGEFVEMNPTVAPLVGPNTDLIVLPSPAVTAQSDQIIGRASDHALPAVYPFKYYVTKGGLLFYGADNVDQWRQAASYVDRILRGAHPRDLPVQLPTKFDLVINVKTAHAIGLTIPRDVLLIADEVIE
jgi:putative tryptophan/tyrosine transport system substrate-binding protein